MRVMLVVLNNLCILKLITILRGSRLKINENADYATCTYISPYTSISILLGK